jgi:hypothetical protein
MGPRGRKTRENYIYELEMVIKRWRDCLEELMDGWAKIKAER